MVGFTSAIILKHLQLLLARENAFFILLLLSQQLNVLVTFTKLALLTILLPSVQFFSPFLMYFIQFAKVKGKPVNSVTYAMLWRRAH